MSTQFRSPAAWTWAAAGTTSASAATAIVAMRTRAVRRERVISSYLSMVDPYVVRLSGLLGVRGYTRAVMPTRPALTCQRRVAAGSSYEALFEVWGLPLAKYL